MNSRLALVTALALSGCLIPVDVTPDDAGAAGDAGFEADAGCAPLTELDVASSGSTVVIPLGGCRAATVAAPDGGNVPLLSNATGAQFVAVEPGVYVVTLTQGGTTTRLPLHVDGAPTGGFVRRYDDRVDRCWRLFVTDLGRLVCRFENEVLVYETTGALLTRFVVADPNSTAESNVSVVGNEIWVRRDDRVEHRTDTDAGIRFDGQLSVSGGLPLLFDARPGRIVVSGGDRVVEVLWNGSTLDAGLVFERLPSLDDPLIVDGELWSSDFCRVEPGCASSLCPVVRTCTMANWNVVGAEGDSRFWVSRETSRPARASSSSWAGR